MAGKPKKQPAVQSGSVDRVLALSERLVSDPARASPSVLEAETCLDRKKSTLALLP
ncbi:hypothetical protein KIPB_013829, partial [Kipferlia bialata]|eukprot:g13829.t1